MERIELCKAAQLLKDADCVLILSHKSPDGDTIGSGFALKHALTMLGKRAWVLCSDPISDRYDYMDIAQEGTPDENAMIVSVDIADTSLLGEKLKPYADRITLSIDHHISNTGYAKYLLLREKAAANCELMLDLIKAMGLAITPLIADCLYTGLVTDTGCFRYASTTVDSHRVAQELLLAGARKDLIHQRMFESTSRGKMSLMVTALQSLRYELGGQCAMMYLPRDRIEEEGVTDDELEGISSIPREIAGVRVGVTLRQYRSRKGYKISVRTDTTVNACAICKRAGGGGHAGAAGCNIEGTTFEEAYSIILKAVSDELSQNS